MKVLVVDDEKIISGALQRVLAIELMTAARGIEMRGETPSPVSAAVIARLRTRVEGVGPDRYLAPEIAAAVDLVVDGSLLAASGLSSSADGGAPSGLSSSAESGAYRNPDPGLDTPLRGTRPADQGGQA